MFLNSLTFQISILDFWWILKNLFMLSKIGCLQKKTELNIFIFSRVLAILSLKDHLKLATHPLALGYLAYAEAVYSAQIYF